ncbi:MAG TPA: cbb3-type cytochrome c oxidase subunit I [Gemmatimonadaceae bacterium]
MDSFVRSFIKSSLAWLAGGVTLGVAMAIWPKLVIYRPAHMHMNLLGFVTMMIMGVGYHLLPRLGGSPLKWKSLGAIHWWIANIGLALMVAGFFLRPSYELFGRSVLSVGAVLSATGALMFVVNIWMTLDAGAVRLAAMQQRAKPLPTNSNS